MKIAYCLYGQPRDYQTGFKHIKEFMEKNPDVTFDFYFHTWKIPSNELYETSTWARCSTDVLKQDTNIEEQLLNLYKPIRYLFEHKITFSIEPYKNTIAFQNMVQPKQIENIHNVLSQMHSRMKVCSLFVEENRHYDYVITSRFDYCKPIDIDLSKINTQKIYVSNVHVPRHIIPDNCMMFPTEIYKAVFTDMYAVLNDTRVDSLMKKHREVLSMNPEELVLANVLKACETTQSVIFTNLLK
jgi:hypothetical protein